LENLKISKGTKNRKAKSLHKSLQRHRKWKKVDLDEAEAEARNSVIEKSLNMNAKF